MELVLGVHMVEGTRGGNVYLLVSDDGLALVDAALPGTTAQSQATSAPWGEAPLSYGTSSSPTPTPTIRAPSLS